MTAQIIDGRAVSASIRQQLEQEIQTAVAAGKRPPGLAVIQVGSDPASSIYVGNKRKTCAALGIHSVSKDFDENISQQTLDDLIDELNADDRIDGILVQSPLPPHLSMESVIERIRSDKDVDGFHPENIGRLAIRQPALRSCTPFGVMKLIESIPGMDLHGMEAVVVGASNVVGRPMALELLLAGATVTVTHRFTKDLESHVRRADLVVAAAGKSGLVKGEWIKPGAIVIDVGMNRDAEGKLCGDVDFAAASERAGYITPVPGGVGPMTIAMLMYNTVTSWRERLAAAEQGSA
jgi:methylenetetrahydrofolate dehydrogenase (NADP+) / methenyltetrahydrofolate cyclohydrolase